MVLAARPMHYLCGLLTLYTQIRYGNAHGLFALSKNLRQLALFLSLYHIKKRLEYRPNKAIVMIFTSKNKSHIISI